MVNEEEVSVGMNKACLPGAGSGRGESAGRAHPRGGVYSPLSEHYVTPINIHYVAPTNIHYVAPFNAHYVVSIHMQKAAAEKARDEHIREERRASLPNLEQEAVWP